MSMNSRSAAARITGRLAEYERLLDSVRVMAAAIGRPAARHNTLLRRLGADRDLRPSPRYGKADIDSALRAFPLDSLPVEERAYYWFASVYADAGDIATARRLIADGDRTLPAHLRTVADREETQGDVAMAEGRWEDAVRSYRAVEGDPGTGCRNCMAMRIGEAFDRMGQPDSALVHFERGIRSPEARRKSSDAQGLPTSLRRAGELAEAKGDRARAREYYTQFLELWAQADADLQPVVRDVRGRLAGLGGDR